MDCSRLLVIMRVIVSPADTNEVVCWTNLTEFVVSYCVICIRYFIYSTAIKQNVYYNIFLRHMSCNM